MDPVDFLKYYLSVESDKFDIDDKSPIADFAVCETIGMSNSEQTLDVLKKYHEVKPNITSQNQPT